MATTNDPRAGAFSAAVFRDAIRFAMRMGAPDTGAAVFKWKDDKTYTNPDLSGKPYNWNAPVSVDETHADVELVPYALEFSGNVAGVTTGNVEGNFENPYAKMTLLDEDHAQIVGAERVLLGGNTYMIRYTEPPFALFDVTVYVLHLQAVDES